VLLFEVSVITNITYSMTRSCLYDEVVQFVMCASVRSRATPLASKQTGFENSCLQSQVYLWFRVKGYYLELVILQEPQAGFSGR
jgi:hypothetical protein